MSSNIRRHARPSVALLMLTALGMAGAATAQALGPAFTYQGELRVASGPASGDYDMQFRLYDAATEGAALAGPLTVLDVPVSQGLFSVKLDFGPAQFAGDRQWLEVAIRPAGTGIYETLAPRTEVTAAPYAWGAAVALQNAVTTTSIVDGTIGAADIDDATIQRRVNGSCPAGQYLRLINRDGTVSCAPDVGAEGSVTRIDTGPGLSGGPITSTGILQLADGGVGTAQINPNQVQRRVSGTCPAGQYLRVVNLDGTVSCGTDALGWGFGGNAGTNPSINFIGTTDNQAFEVRTRNTRSLRIEPSAELFGGTPITSNLIGGSSSNSITAGVRGATIAGGGVPTGASDPFFPGEAPNVITDSYGFIGGGYANQAGDGDLSAINKSFATVGGGVENRASGFGSVVAGGDSNQASGQHSAIGGGTNNLVSAVSAMIGGGAENTASGDFSAVSGGLRNTASAQQSFVGAGFGNIASGGQSVVTGGSENCAGGSFSWASGRGAKVRPATNPGAGTACSGLTYPGGNGDQGTFVWADSQTADFVSTGPNQFLMRAAGGVGVNTTAIPNGIEAVVQSRPGPNQNVDLYLKPSFSGRGINLAMLPGSGAAAFYISQYDGTSFVDRILLESNGDFVVTAQASKPGGGPWATVTTAEAKTAVQPIARALDRLLSLRGVSFEYRADRMPKAMYLPGRQMGLDAEQVAATFPDWVSETEDGHTLVAPRGFEALTVEALRELRAERAQADGARVSALEAQNAALRAETAALRESQSRIQAELAELRALVRTATAAR